MSEDSHQSIRTEAIESLLMERGLLKDGVVDMVIERFNERVGPMNGARVVARAWTDPEFKRALLEDGTKAIEPFKLEGGQVEKLAARDPAPLPRIVARAHVAQRLPGAPPDQGAGDARQHPPEGSVGGRHCCQRRIRERRCVGCRIRRLKERLSQGSLHPGPVG